MRLIGEGTECNSALSIQGDFNISERSGKFDKNFKENKREMFDKSICIVKWYFRKDSTIDKSVALFIDPEEISIRTKLNSNFKIFTK